MKKIATLFLIIVLTTRCGSDNPPAPTPTITDFTPTSGILGTEVTITGTNFSAEPSENLVEFFGEEATVTAASKTELTVTVPTMATTGKIYVTVDGQTGVSASDFTVPDPTIAAFEPAIGASGLTGVIITGTNFSTIPAQNIITFNNVAGTVTASTPTQLTATVGPASSTGKIAVTVGANTGTSFDNFIICNNAELIVTISFTNITPGTSCSYDYTIKNVGASPLDLTKFTLQAYLSADAVYGGGDAAGGGTQLDAGGTLNTGQSYTSNWSSNGNVVNTYQYLIIDFFNDTADVTECNTENNRIIKLIQ